MEYSLLDNEIKSLAKAFKVIEFIAAHEKPVALSLISSSCNLPPATAHRIVSSLCSLGYVINEGGGSYKTSLKMFEISSPSVAGNNMVSTVRPYVEQLSEDVGESVHLVIRDGCDIVYVYKVARAIGSIQMASRIGMRIPMYRTAAGKAILASCSNEEIKEVFFKSDIKSVTEKTITSLGVLLNQIDRIRERGYAVDNEENEKNVCCIGVALSRPYTKASYAISVSSLSSRMDYRRIEEIAEIMKELKTRIALEFIP